MLLLFRNQLVALRRLLFILLLPLMLLGLTGCGGDSETSSGPESEHVDDHEEGADYDENADPEEGMEDDEGPNHIEDEDNY